MRDDQYDRDTEDDVNRCPCPRLRTGDAVLVGKHTASFAHELTSERGVRPFGNTAPLAPGGHPNPLDQRPEREQRADGNQERCPTIDARGQQHEANPEQRDQRNGDTGAPEQPSLHRRSA